MADSSSQKKSPPVARVQVGTIQGAVWRRDTDKGVFYNATFTNRYKDAAGKWHDGDSYGHLDLLAVKEAASQLYADIEGLKAKDRAEGSAGRDTGDDG